MKRFVIFLLLVAAWAPRSFASGPSTSQATANKQLLRFEESLDSMGTTFTVVAYGSDRFRLQAAVESSLDEAKRLEELLSNYRPESEWSRMNRSAASGPVQVSKELFDLL